MSRPAALQQRRLLVIAILFAFGFTLNALVNYHLPRAFTAGDNWNVPHDIPVLNPKGADLRIFLDASKNMFAGRNPLHGNYNSPPFTSLFYYPFSILPINQAYSFHYALTLAANIISLALILRLLAEAARTPAAPDTTMDTRVCLALTGAFCLSWQLYASFFEFALERGNYDSFALLGIIAGCYATFLRPDNRWLPIVCFSFATHLKVYPGLFLVLLCALRGRSALWRILVLNVALLLCFGPVRAWEFLEGLYYYSQAAYVWQGNHSAFAFSQLHMEPVLAPVLAASIVHKVSLIVLLGFPIALWAHGVLILRRTPDLVRKGLLIAALSMPLLSFVPSVSHDYKLVIQVFPVAVALFYSCEWFVDRGSAMALGALAASFLCAALMARSALAPSWPVLDNKYPALILLELVLYGVAFAQTFRGRPHPVDVPAAC